MRIWVYKWHRIDAIVGRLQVRFGTRQIAAWWGSPNRDYKTLFSFVRA